MTKDTQVVVSSGQVSTTLDDGVAILNLDSSMYYGLNDVASDIWKLMGEQRTVGTIYDALLTQYDVEPEVFHNDLFEFLRQLQEAGLILVDTDVLSHK